MDKETSRPEAAFVLLLAQATLWAIAGLSAFPFVLGGEVFMIGLGLASILLAAFTCIVAIGLVKRRRRARRWAIGLEVTCLVGSLLQLVLPIGANHGPVSMLTNVGLPLAVVVLLRGKMMRAHFAGPAGAAAAALPGLQPPGRPLEGRVRVGGRDAAPSEVSQREPIAGGLRG